MPGAPSIRRLLGEWVGDEELHPADFPQNASTDQRYTRHEGGLLSRALGTVVHTLLEDLSKLRKSSNWEQAHTALKQLQPRIAAQIRATGVDPSKSAAIAAEAFRLVFDATNDPTGNWILSPHPEDSSEVRWTGVVAGNLRTVQVDRLFRAGLTPLSNGDEAWWIIDYKTAHADDLDPANALPDLRKLFAPQLETYAAVLANLKGKETPIRAGLYYPRMLLFDWWEI
jgi:ATP-dependent exoDNAse (exonuclease V) beta subunit